MLRAYRMLMATGLLLVLMVAMPNQVQAQSAIVGVVADTTGAALPGVTVEASSPALIEKVKSTVSDGEGAYRVAHRPEMVVRVLSI